MQIAEETSVAPPRMTGVGRALQKAEQWLGSTVAAAAALLVVVEIVVLFTGVSARYFFQRPLIWSDELAGILFLWLAMLGAVVAFQRAEHMRMTAFVGKLSPGRRAFFDVLGIAAPLAFLALVLQPRHPLDSLQLTHAPALSPDPRGLTATAWGDEAVGVRRGL